MERPNTVAGLIEKRRELVARRKLAEADIKAFTSGIDAIDIVLKLFGSEIDTANAKPRRLPIPHAAGRVRCVEMHWSFYAKQAPRLQVAWLPSGSVRSADCMWTIRASRKSTIVPVKRHVTYATKG